MNNYERDALKRLRPHLSECAVLLKSNGDFPLSAPCEIGAYGRGVRHTLKGGTGSGEVNSRYYVTVEQGLREAGFSIGSIAWLNQYDEVLVQAEKDFVEEIKQRAKAKHTVAIMEGMGAVMKEPEHSLVINNHHEVAIYVVSRICGEGNDRTFEKGDFLLNDSEIRDILYLNEHSDKFMLVLNVGGPVDLTPVNEVDNILLLSQLGVETGSALADILLGKENPSGKLTTTWAKPSDYNQDGEFGNLDDTNYTEGIYVGYRYFDTVNKKALYPFGYGLSYSEFEIKAENVLVEKDKVCVKASVKNIGKYGGKETVQLYVSCPDGKLAKPYQDLAGYKKTGLIQPGEKEEVSICFSLRELASYDEEKACYILEKGGYILRLGNSSCNTRVIGVIDLDEEAIVRQVKNVLGKPGFEDKVYERQLEDCPETAHLNISGKDIICETVQYGKKYPVNEAVEKLSDEELAYLNIGAFSEAGGIGSVIGNAAHTVAGAAGESSTKANLLQLKPLVMADGPAGLRISPQYYEDEKGLHSYGPSMPASMLNYMPKILRKIMGGTPKLKKGTILKEQYTTAIPIGTAIAQSFNDDFASECGDIVGREMEIFNVDLWLAPALNIHRNVLCGRNFEYFSEDPLISGKMAAAITRGVQSHKGKGTTIKHYAANNQETNRYVSSSNVSERAMREIYLKGFEIAVRESAPLALMTSYNLLNGVHTNEHHGLCTDILRDEFGYEGLIMTDWVISMMPVGKGKYHLPDADKVALAGGNLYMPGGKGDFKKVLKAVKEGSLDRQVLRESASRLYDTVLAVK